jgi:hypothetical protein
MITISSKRQTGQAMIEFTLGFVLVGIFSTATLMLFGPTIGSSFNAMATSFPPLRMGGIPVEINPPEFTPTVGPTQANTPTKTVAPTNTAMAAPTNTPIPGPTNTPIPAPTNTATARPTNTATARPTNTPTIQPTNTPTVAPTLTLQEWCLAMGYRWVSTKGICKNNNGVIVTPPP